MIIVSYNIKGGGSLIKRRRIRYTLASGKTDICLIKESKFNVLDSSKIFSFGYVKDVCWSGNPSLDLS
ncbi:unnamed protein product [Lathyrus sativus]|nr:unnamed protein product [Lathyrus sativus]